MNFSLNARAAASVFAMNYSSEIDQDCFLALWSKSRQVWELPGGKMNPGETLLQTAEREFQEETGRKTNIGNVIGVYSNGTGDGNTFIHVIFATMVMEQFKPILSEQEHSEFRWMGVRQAKEMGSALSPRLRCLIEETSGHAVFCRDVTDRDWYSWYPGERPEVGRET